MADFIVRAGRRCACIPRLDIGGIYVIATTGKLTSTVAGAESITYSINPYQWALLPEEGIFLWKVRHPVIESEADYPVQVALPVGTASTVPVNTTTGTASQGVPVVDKKNNQMTGSDMNNTTAGSNGMTDRLVYYNKSCGVFRLLGEEAAAAAPVPNT